MPNLKSYFYEKSIYFSSTTLGVGDVDDSSFSVYPNPFDHQIQISTAHAVQQARVFNLAGKEVLRAAPNAASFTLHNEHLNKGVYLLSLSANGKETTAKLVK